MLNPEFRDILSEFCTARVEYLLVGAYALAAHGLPRATGDIDLWVRMTPDNAQRVWSALVSFGAPMAEIDPLEFARPGLIFQVGVAPRRIDVITEIDGVGFDEAWANRIATEVEGITVTVIGRGDLLKNKRAAGRPKDQADVLWLEQTS